MSSTTINASPSGFGSMVSGYGSTTWSVGSGAVIFVSTPAGVGSAWAIWRCIASGLPPGQPLTGINMQGLCSFITGSGGVSQKRFASLHVDVFRIYTDFTNGLGTPAGQQWQADGSSVPMSFTFSKAGLNTDDLAAGNFYVGVCLSTAYLDPGAGNGVFHFSAFNWTLTFNEAPPQSDKVNARADNPSPNVDPGKLPGAQFDSVRFNFLGPIPQGGMTFAWSLPAGITFANGQGSMSQAKGTGGDPTNPYSGDSGPMSIAATTPPGTYTLTVAVQGLSFAPSYQLSTQLVVARPLEGVAPLYYCGVMAET